MNETIEDFSDMVINDIYHENLLNGISICETLKQIYELGKLDGRYEYNPIEDGIKND